MMVRVLVAALAALVLSVGTAAAQCSSIQYSFTNGTTADASQVNANFGQVLGCANQQAAPAILQGWIAGLTMSNDTTNPNTVIDTAKGVANSDDATYMMSLAAFTKSTGAWAVGTGNGCLDAGSVAQNTWYHLFVIARTDTGVVDQLCSTNVNPTGTMPANYTKKRRIGSFKTGINTTNILAFVQDGDYFRWKASIQDFNSGNPGASATLRIMTVPLGVNVLWFGNFTVGTTTGANIAAYVSDPAANDEAPQFHASAPGATSSYLAIAGQAGVNEEMWQMLTIRTNTSAQIRTRLSFTDGNTFVTGVTLGWFDTRGRFN